MIWHNFWGFKSGFNGMLGCMTEGVFLLHGKTPLAHVDSSEEISCNDNCNAPNHPKRSSGCDPDLLPTVLVGFLPQEVPNTKIAPHSSCTTNQLQLLTFMTKVKRVSLIELITTCWD